MCALAPSDRTEACRDALSDLPNKVDFDPEAFTAVDDQPQTFEAEWANGYEVGVQKTDDGWVLDYVDLS